MVGDGASPGVTKWECGIHHSSQPSLLRLPYSHPLHNTLKHAGALVLQPLLQNPRISHYSSSLSHNRVSLAPFSHIGVDGVRRSVRRGGWRGRRVGEGGEQCRQSMQSISWMDAIAVVRVAERGLVLVWQVVLEGNSKLYGLCRERKLWSEHCGSHTCSSVRRMVPTPQLCALSNGGMSDS